MTRVARKVKDDRLLRLIGNYLRAGVMVEGVLQRTEEGTPQGGPASPLLANILLDDLDKELEKRGLPFVRYADDFAIFAKSERAAQRIMESVTRYLTEELRLVVNPTKSRVVSCAQFEYLGFSFAGAGSRFDARRALIVQETNSIGTAWLRLEVLPEASRAPLQAKFREYVDTRIAAYRAFPDTAAARAALGRARAMQGAIWSEALTAAVAMPTTSGTILLMPALNAMFDDASTRDAALMAHLPVTIFALLIFLVLCCGVLAGYGMTTGGPRSWLHLIGFSAVITIMLYVITDYEYPRRGRITLAAYDRLMVDLRQEMQ